MENRTTNDVDVNIIVQCMFCKNVVYKEMKVKVYWDFT
jgi:hypothetical protein